MSQRSGEGMGKRSMKENFQRIGRYVYREDDRMIAVVQKRGGDRKFRSPPLKLSKNLPMIENVGIMRGSLRGPAARLK
jgi:hypothetical protein